MNIEIQPVGFGAEIKGVDAASIADESTFHALRDALHSHSVIFLRNQHLSIEELIAFTKKLGLGPLKELKQPWIQGFPEIAVLSNIVADGRPIGLQEAGQYWHTDLSYALIPLGYSILHALEIPRDESGAPLGDTLFADVGRAYDTLAEDVKERLRGLKGIHYLHNRFREKNKTYTEEAKVERVPHPIVRSHPVTGHPCLYVNQQYAESIEGMNEAESRALIDFLCAHITRPQSLYRHRWQVGDLVLWDDCLVQHKAIGDYKLPQRRLMHRTSITGSAPFFRETP